MASGLSLLTVWHSIGESPVTAVGAKEGQCRCPRAVHSQGGPQHLALISAHAHLSFTSLCSCENGASGQRSGACLDS